MTPAWASNLATSLCESISRSTTTVHSTITRTITYTLSRISSSSNFRTTAASVMSNLPSQDQAMTGTPKTSIGNATPAAPDPHGLSTDGGFAKVVIVVSVLLFIALYRKYGKAVFYPVQGLLILLLWSITEACTVMVVVLCWELALMRHILKQCLELPPEEESPDIEEGYVIPEKRASTNDKGLAEQGGFHRVERRP
ncbi:hypothetical protein SCUCBS95973_006025 [Sporothrix curviconia]|uniref:Uncharacterized protein n=1 Tax=Sporothrix curviconia TaxID=1260050 RepID=A0ABP0C1Q0_9PEZI